VTSHPICECGQEWCPDEHVIPIGMGLYAQLVDRNPGPVCIVDPHHVQPGDVELERTGFYAVIVDRDR
jgi:hypothetical protein